MAEQLSPIHKFASDGNLAGVFAELVKGVPVDARNPNNDRTPLMEAIAGAQPDVDLVRLLIEKGADVNAVATQVPLRISGEQSLVREENVLSLSLRASNVGVVETLLNAGADIHYKLPYNYDAIIDAVYGGCRPKNHVFSILKLLIDRGARLSTESDYGESGLNVAANRGRFDIVRVLLDAGADAALLQWTPLMHAIALGSLSDVEAELGNNPDLSARDFWSRTPWLLSIDVGDVAKAKLLLAAGASRADRGRCGKLPLIYPIAGGDTDMLLWLLSEGFDPNDADGYSATPLMEAAEAAAAECARILIEAGADIHFQKKHRGPAIKEATSLETVRLLVNRGAHLNDINDEMRAALTHQSVDGKLDCSRDEYFAGKHRRFGTSNPEKMNVSFWAAMVRSGIQADQARRHFDDTADENEPIWCFRRFGKSINELPDGRIIEIAGEHEDSYDPEFCIYNDVTVHHADGSFDIYGYPKEIFPLTDCHTATLVGRYIYLIGSIGYRGERRYGDTPVYRLDIESFEIEELKTSGEKPGWIHGHKATLSGESDIRIVGGRVCVLGEGKEQTSDNRCEYSLNLGSLQWRKDR